MISSSNLLITGGTFTQNLLTTSRGSELLTQNVATQARHDSGEVSDPAKCHPDTRVAILTDLEEWADSPTYNYPIRWVTGSAGVGKTAIMRTTAENLERRKLLLAAFFFWRTGERCNSAQFFIATLAYQIAISIPETRPHIELAVEKNPHIFTQKLEVQSRVLIVDPITTVYRNEAFPSNYPRIFVIDGLDECLDGKMESQDIERQCEILKSLHFILQQLPVPFALLIASRPEYHIRSIFDTTLKGISSSLLLNDSTDVDEDIKRFYVDKFREIREHHPLRSYLPSPEWPSSDTIHLLIWRASGQFIYASTVIKFIAASKKNPCNQLGAILDKEVLSNTNPFQGLDALYSTIFSTIPEEDLEDTLEVLGVLLLGRTAGRHRAFHPSFWDHFLGLQQGEVQRLMLGLESVLSIDGPEGDSLHFFHASLQDFLFNYRRSGAFFIDRHIIYEKLAKQGIFHFATTDDVMGQFIIIEMEYWFPTANPSIELYNIIEKARFSMRGQDLKSRYPELLRAIEGLKLPAKQSLYEVHLDIFHTHLKQVIPLYCNEESLAFLFLGFLHESFHSRQSFENFIDDVFHLAPELARIDREQGLYLYKDRSFNERNMSTFRSAVKKVLGGMTEADDLYAQAASFILKSCCRKIKGSLLNIVDPLRFFCPLFCDWLNKASTQTGLPECIKNNPIIVLGTAGIVISNAVSNYLSRVDQSPYEQRAVVQKTPETKKVSKRTTDKRTAETEPTLRTRKRSKRTSGEHSAST